MKHRLFALITVIALLPVSLFVGVQSVEVRAAGCTSVTTLYSPPGALGLSINVGAGETVTLSPSAGPNATLSLRDTTNAVYAIVHGQIAVATKPGHVDASSGTATPNTLYTLTACPPGSGAGILLRFNDGRCNQAPDAPVVVYPDGKGGYYFYTVDKGVGYFAMYLTKAQLDANPANGSNTMIADSLGARLYRLVGGQLQVDRYKPDGKDYAFIFPPCDI